MQRSFQWLLQQAFQVRRRPLPPLTKEKEVWGAVGSCLVFSSKESKLRACGCKTAPGKQVEAATKQQCCSLVLFSPLYFSLQQSLLSTSLQGAGKSSCGSLRPRPSNQVVYQTLPGTGKTTTAQAAFASVFQKQPPKSGPCRVLPGMAQRGTWKLKAWTAWGMSPHGLRVIHYSTSFEECLSEK